MRTALLSLFLLLNTFAVDLSKAEIETLKQARAAEDPAKAESILREHLKKERPPTILFELGVLLSKRQANEEAAKLFREVATADPEYPNVKLNLGLTLAASGKLSEAVQWLQPVAKREGLTARLALVLGQCYLATGKPVAAESCLRVASTGYADDSRIQLALAESLMHQKRHADAEAVAMERLGAAPDDCSAWRIVANARLSAGHYGTAIDALEALLRLDPKDQESMLALGDLYLQEGMPTQAVATYRRAQKLGDVPVERMQRLARGLVDTGHPKEAKTVTARLVAEDAKNAHAQCSLGLALLALNEYAAAEKTLITCTKLDPLNGRALIALGDAQLKQGKLDAALGQYRAARSIEGWTRMAMEAEAEARLQHEQYRAALELLLQLQERFPSSRWKTLITDLRALVTQKGEN